MGTRTHQQKKVLTKPLTMKHTDQSDTLYLEINGEIVEAVKVFGKTDEQRNVTGLEKSYNLKPTDNYKFFYKKFSLMNGKTEEQISNALAAKANLER